MLCYENTWWLRITSRPTCQLSVVSSLIPSTCSSLLEASSLSSACLDASAHCGKIFGFFLWFVTCYILPVRSFTQSLQRLLYRSSLRIYGSIYYTCIHYILYILHLYTLAHTTNVVLFTTLFSISCTSISLWFISHLSVSVIICFPFSTMQFVKKVHCALSNNSLYMWIS